MIELPEPLVTVEWLSANLNHPDLVLLNSTLKPALSIHSMNMDMQIPGTRLFDIENIFSDRQSPLPHMLPSAVDFTREARHLGIRKDSLLVIYDRQGIYCSPRARRM